MNKIKRVYAINNPQLYNAFNVYRNLLWEKLNRQEYLFKSTSWMDAPDSGARRAHYNKFMEYTTSYPWNISSTHVNVIPMLQGTSKTAAWNIVKQGFATVATLDDGWFGKGIYFTSAFEWARFFSTVASRKDLNAEKCMVLSLVIPGNIYPVTEAHDSGESLRGKSVKGTGYQSHYTNVHAANSYAGGKAFLAGHVCNPPAGKVYDELVVFQDAQALPLFVIDVKAAD